jgi:hypothetical protein
MNGDVTLNLEQSRSVDQSSRLRIDSVGRVGIGYGGDGAGLLLLLGIPLGIVEFDIAFEEGGMGSIVGRPLLELLLQLLILLLIRR